MQIAELNRIYLETNCNLAPFLNLYQMAKGAGYSVGHVVCLLGVANNGLSELEQRYNNLKSEVDWLEAKKRNLLKVIQDNDGQISALGKKFDECCQSCEQEEKKWLIYKERE